MFQLQGAVIRPLIEKQIPILLLVYNWDPNCLHYCDIVVYSILI